MALNRAEIIGHLGADPEIRTFDNGGKVANLSVATTRKWKDRNSGETREETEWHRVSIVADGLAGIADRYLRKGSKVYLAGRLRTRKWQDQSGQDRYTTEIVLTAYEGTLEMLGGPRDSDDRSGGGYGGGTRNDPPPPQGGLDDEIPF